MKNKKSLLLCLCLLLIGGCRNATQVNNNNIPSPTAAIFQELSDNLSLTPTEPAYTPSPIPTPTMTPAPTDTPVLTPTCTPAPTNTPTPPPIVYEGKPSYSFKMGDNVWYELYGSPKYHEGYNEEADCHALYIDASDMILVISGTGSTKDCGEREWRTGTYPPGDRSAWFFSAYVDTIIIEEGITRIGDYALAGFSYAKNILIASTLTELGECAFWETGYTGANWYGLDMSRISAMDNTFRDTSGLEDRKEILPLMASPTPTPGPKPSPVAPMPTQRPDATPIPGYYVEKQIGDNIYVRFYNNGIAHMIGHGSTWDFDSVAEATNILRNSCETAIVEEGITRIGDFGMAFFRHTTQVILPSSLKELGEYAFYDGESYKGCTWTGWDPSNWTMKPNSLFGCDKAMVDDSLSEYCNMFSTPIDPDNPKVRHTMQMGDNVIFEFWDNGYLYVKGTGSVWNRGELFRLCDPYENDEAVLEELCYSITHVIVEEGITSLGRYAFNGINSIEECRLPSTLSKMELYTVLRPNQIYLYYKGEPYLIIPEENQFIMLGQVYQKMDLLLADEETKAEKAKKLEEDMTAKGYGTTWQSHVDYRLMYKYTVIPQ